MTSHLHILGEKERGATAPSSGTQGGIGATTPATAGTTVPSTAATTVPPWAPEKTCNLDEDPICPACSCELANPPFPGMHV